MRFALYCFVLLVSLLPRQLYANEAQPAPNLILIIGDGMDDQQITIARNYLKGSRGRLTLDTLPHRSMSQVLTVSNLDPDKVVYVADSANSATSIATGVPTSRGRIATSAHEDKDLTTIVELANAAGLKTGIVTTASVTDATPASFAAHIDKRFCENPSMMVDGLLFDRFPVHCRQDTLARGGMGSISEQLAKSEVDIILGGGEKHFAMNAENSQKTVLELAQENGFHIVRTAEELTQLPDNKKILGLFAEHTLPVRMRGEGDREAETPDRSALNYLHDFLGEVELPEPMRCESNPEFGATPSLATMTEAAIARLHTGKGFFLMIESASIDKQSHQRKACGSIGEVGQLDEAVQVALEFANRNPNTMLLVTADHGHAAQLIPETSLFSNAQIGNLPMGSPGRLTRIITPEGSVMAVNYATNRTIAEEHSGVSVPLLANDIALGKIPPLIHQPDIFRIMKKHLGI